MNCDQAFDHMTSMAGDESPALREHLANCPRCREMREVLSPAAALFARGPVEESIVAGNESSRPARQTGPASEEAVRIAESMAAQLSGQTSVQRAMRRRRPLGWGRAVALFGGGVLAASFVTMIASAIGPQGRVNHGITPPHGSKCTWLSERRAESSKRESPRDVVTACVHCHMQTSALDRQAERFDILRAWLDGEPAAPTFDSLQPAPAHLLIAEADSAARRSADCA